MTFPRYPKYKDSGVEWLGEIPHDWAAVPFYSVAFERDESNKGMIEDNLLSLSYGRIVEKNIESNDGLLPESFETYQVTHPNDIIFRLTDLQNDKRSLRTAIVNEKGIITSAYIAVAPSKINAQFLNYLLRAYDLTKVFYSMGGGLRQSMKFSDIKRLPTVLPTPAEQTKIAVFLDKETAKIDALIADQDKLVELLKEKRQGIISHAVTKGLNPKAKMKDSGVEWLGEVPEGWEVISLRRIVKEHRQGYYSSESYSDSGIKLLRITDLKEYGNVSYDTCPMVEDREDVKEFILQAGDFVFARTGGAGSFGLIGDISHRVAYASYLIRFRFFSNVLPGFMRFYFLSVQFMSGIQKDIHGGVNQNVHAEDIKNQIFILPSVGEQNDILEFLEYQTVNIDKLINEANKASDLLKERRSAIISAAVTGKIDIRGAK